MSEKKLEQDDIAWAQLSTFDPDNVAHQGFIFGNWCNHLKNFEGYRKKSRDEFRAIRQRIGVIVERCPPVIAHSIQGEPCYGFVCSEYLEPGGEQVMHFLYVKNLYRQNGIGTMLAKAAFYKLGKETIYQTYPMLRAKFFRDKWMLNYDTSKRHIHEKRD